MPGCVTLAECVEETAPPEQSTDVAHVSEDEGSYLACDVALYHRIFVLGLIQLFFTKKVSFWVFCCGCHMVNHL